MNEFLNNMDRLHTTFLGEERIRRNLKIPNKDVVLYLKNKIMNERFSLSVKGKNYYCVVDNICITINRFTYTIITALILK